MGLESLFKYVPLVYFHRHHLFDFDFDCFHFNHHWNLIFLLVKSKFLFRHYIQDLDYLYDSD